MSGTTDDTTTQTPPPDYMAQAIALAQKLAPPPAMPSGTPDDGTKPSWTGLLGRALSGGQAPGYQLRGSQADTSGNRALLNFGVNMLLASGPHASRPDLLSSAATGLQGAQESLGQDQQRAAQLAAAQQTYAQQQFQNRIAALKEAVPLITLDQKTRAIGATPSSLGGSTGATPAPGSGANAAGAQTDYAGGIIGLEGSGQSGTSSAAGPGQFLDSTWKDFAAANPQLFAGMSPDQMMAARTDKTLGPKLAPLAVEWLAKRNAAELTAAGATPSGPSLGIAHFIGPQAAAAVMAAPDNAPVKQFVSDAAVKANPQLATMTAGQMRQKYAGLPAPGFLAPPSAAASPGGAPVAPQPGAPPVAQAGQDADAVLSRLRTQFGPGVQTAGPGAPTDTGTVAAPGAAPIVAPAQPGTAPAVAAPASTPEAIPPAFEDYLQQHPITPTADDLASFSTAPDAAQLANLQKQAAIADTAYRAARANLDTPGMAKASSDYNTILAKEDELRQAANKQGSDARTAFFKDRRQQAFDAWKEAMATNNTRETNRQQAEQTRLTNKDQVINSVNQEGLKTAQTELASSRSVVSQLDGFQALSDNVGQPGWMQTTKLPGSDATIAERLQQLGISKDDNTQGSQLLQSGLNNLVKTLREGMTMGSLSDRDLSFIQRMGPTEWMDRDTRTAAVSYLRQAYKAKQQFNNDLIKEMSRGTNYGDAFDLADKKQKPFVPAVPPDISAAWYDTSPAAAQARGDWARKNGIGPGMMIHLDDGTILVTKRPNQGPR